MGWSTWNHFRFNVSHDGLVQVATQFRSLGLLAAGYNYILLDDGWPSCAKVNQKGGCDLPSPRDPATSYIVPDPVKFPGGIAAAAAAVHALGFKFGIYSAPHHITCGGFTGSLNFEAVDTAAFAEWGVDFVKMDAGCQNDAAALHNGSLVASLRRVSAGIAAAGRPTVFYIDDGNPASGPRVYNPKGRGVTALSGYHNALVESEWAPRWFPEIAHVAKIWYDRGDNWDSLTDTVRMIGGGPTPHNQWVHGPGQWITPDMAWIGSGGMSAAEYTYEWLTYCVLAAPLILSFDPAAVDAATLALVTNPRLLAVAQDPDGVMGSLVRRRGDMEVWIKPLSTGAFAVVMGNTGAADGVGSVMVLEDGLSQHNDFMAASFAAATVVDAVTGAAMGVMGAGAPFRVPVPAHSAVMLIVTPTSA